MNFLRKEAGLKHEQVSQHDQVRLRAAVGGHRTTKLQLSPEDGLLEHCSVLGAEGIRAVPVLPGGDGWRKKAFDVAHQSPVSGHLSCDKTCNRLKRQFWWPKMWEDVEAFSKLCESCMATRARPQQLPVGVVAPTESVAPPWCDVYIDFQGPFPETVRGHKYICTYVCKLLRAPMLVPCQSLEKEEAMQAVVTAFLRTLTLPWICRHDRGPEFTNALHQEMSALLGVRQRVPGAHRPMEVG